MIKCRHLLCTYCIALSTNKLNNRITTKSVAGNISFFLKSMSICKMDIKLLLYSLSRQIQQIVSIEISGKTVPATFIRQGEQVNGGNDNFSKSKVVKAIFWS